MAGIKPLGKEGFSLLEVLVSLVILAVGLPALAMLRITAIKGNAIASRWTVATQPTQHKLEGYRHATWDCVVSSTGGLFSHKIVAGDPDGEGSRIVQTITMAIRPPNQ